MADWVNGMSVNAGRALLATGSAHASWNAGWSYAADGRLRVAVGGTVANGKGAFGTDTSGALCVVDIAGGALPAGTTFQDGCAFDGSGRLVVDSVRTADVYAAGWPMANVGALVATLSA